MTNTPPSLRLFELLETMCAHGQPFSLGDAIEATGWPKPSVHRMLGQLESGGLLAREPDGRRYTPAPRLLRLAESTLSAGTQHGVRHAVLRQLVADIGESCNLTALSGAEVIYLDRVESAFPLRMELRPGTRVPIHCSASGKLFLSYLPKRSRERFLRVTPLVRHTQNTLTDPAKLSREFETIRANGYAVDNEEYLPGISCVAVPVRDADARVVAAVAVQAPTTRMRIDQAMEFLPELRQAADAIAQTIDW